MTQIAGPTIKTISYRILAALEDAPDGTLTRGQLLPLLSYTCRSYSKLVIHVAPLLVCNLVVQLADGLQLLPLGRAYLRQHHCAEVFNALPDIKPAETGSMALPRTAPAFKPLSMDRLMRGKPMRDGMDDHLSVPSLIGVKRVMLGDAK